VDDGDVSKVPHDATTLVGYNRFDFDVSVKQLIIVIRSFNPHSGSVKWKPSARSDFQLENKFLDWSEEDSACSTWSIQWIVLRTVGCWLLKLDVSRWGNGGKHVGEVKWSEDYVRSISKSIKKTKNTLLTNRATSKASVASANLDHRTWMDPKLHNVAAILKRSWFDELLESPTRSMVQYLVG